MTMGLKIHRMLKDERSDPPEMVEEANRRKNESDGILEMIYNKLVHKRKDKKTSLLDEEGDEGL
ncbi:MAG: hypothetical protein ACMUHY_09575 [Thermoplasmatota archaeon]